MNKSDYVFQLCAYHGYTRKQLKGKTLKQLKRMFLKKKWRYKMIFELQEIYLDMLYNQILYNKIAPKEYFILGKYKGKTLGISKEDLVKGIWKPKEI